MALARYTMVRGKRPPDDPLPQGLRLDTRKHTRSPLRPDPHEVSTYLEAPSAQAFDAFAARYTTRLEQRFAEDPTAFDRLAEQARRGDVYLGCSCPTRKNPSVHRCHTVLALRFMQAHYPDLEVRFP